MKLEDVWDKYRSSLKAFLHSHGGIEQPLPFLVIFAGLNLKIL